MKEVGDVALEPFFLEHTSMRIFCNYFSPAGAARGNYVFVPPFAEEMNRSRSIVAMQARSLARHGFGVLLVDLHGTGDSGGEFGDATWVSWKSSIVAGCRWLDDRGGCTGMWGLRLGALLAAELIDSGEISPNHAVFWQPVINARNMLTQFLRIKVAASIDLKDEKVSVADLRQTLSTGASVEVGGYEVSAELARELDEKLMSDCCQFENTFIDWVEVSPNQDAVLAPASLKAIEALEQGGVSIRSTVCNGPLFWQLHERTLAMGLMERTSGIVLDRND